MRRGSTLAARVVCGLLRLPASGTGVPITLAVAPSGTGVQWRRTFGAAELCSQQLVENGELVERFFGGVECRFRLEARDGTLVFHQTSTAVNVGGHRVRVPRWLAPRVTSSTRAVSGSRVHADVAITLPICGLLLDYANDVDAGD